MIVKPHIKEVIVVEGKDDITALRRAVDADIVITNGLQLDDEKIAEIKALNEKYGVIVFTDPDFPGGKIRHKLKDAIPNLKHAYINKEDARCPKTGRLGVEYASPQAIIHALEQAKAEQAEKTESYTLNDLLIWGLTGTSGSSARREALCNHFSIGHTNGKQLLYKLNSYQIARKDIEDFLATLPTNPNQER